MSPERVAPADTGAIITGFIVEKLDEAQNCAPPDGGSAPLVIGLCGSQGIGKSTVAARILSELAALGHRVMVIGLDDLYLPLADRLRLAEAVHPLLATRGVPGTHDVDLGLALLDAARQPGHIAMPRFDKASDDLIPREDWRQVETPPTVILLEGWCVGAVPQSDAGLTSPVNALERLDDADGTWRRYVNNALGGPYQQLFARLDALVLLAAPDFEIVTTWRCQQEAQHRSESASQQGSSKTMDKAEIERFVLHYERLTRHILDEMPSRADLVLQLDRERAIVTIGGRSIWRPRDSGY